MLELDSDRTWLGGLDRVDKDKEHFTRPLRQHVIEFKNVMFYNFEKLFRVVLIHCSCICQTGLAKFIIVWTWIRIDNICGSLYVFMSLLVTNTFLL